MILDDYDNIAYPSYDYEYVAAAQAPPASLRHDVGHAQAPPASLRHDVGHEYPDGAQGGASLQSQA